MPSSRFGPFCPFLARFLVPFDSWCSPEYKT
ncbi:hypothetical protein F383_03504 [Gossypium arboreum]|uniref:Uncharacterized protein n=1 Tax=Gossypium arboreum TaxID=29729 RepID=A0A0B0P8R4_GOSAR|nr:hypothetical protein F383_07246 [Gossypium arboreum]KHG21435.1 hypothetical protein F383_03504 [Gossypium arboreum]